MRQQRPLNQPRRIQVLLHPRKRNIAFVIPRIFQSHRGLQRKPLDKVRLVERQLPSMRRRHNQLRHPLSVAIIQGITGQRRTGDACRSALIRNDLIPISQPGSRKRRPRHLQLPHHDPQHLLEHLILANCRMHLARGLKQRL